LICWATKTLAADDQTRFARSDSQSAYVHWIDLFDEDSSAIDPKNESAKPYSPAKTCGRCHDFQTISHGWHFNAVEFADTQRNNPDQASPSGSTPGDRPGQPWIWKDARTGTYLPLSFRGWKGAFSPDQMGITRWSMAKHFGGYLPGAGPGSLASFQWQQTRRDAAATQPSPPAPSRSKDRSDVTGPLPIDCLLCHRGDRSYSPEQWTRQIELENFQHAPTVAAGLAIVEGSQHRRPSKLDGRAAGEVEEPGESDAPRVKYDPRKFRQDGKVFFDIVRKPTNNACYYCHSNVSANQLGAHRFEHDEDVHLRSGIACADCHRNGIDHRTVRGFESEHAGGALALASLSCRGCHLGSPSDGAASHEVRSEFQDWAGRFGAPRPAHRGLPPLHFEKLTCTACHSGPLPQDRSERTLNSIAHGLGASAHRSVDDLPGIVQPVMLPVEGVYTPHRLMWPAYWGWMQGDKIQPLEPEAVYQWTRKALKVRSNLTEEITTVKPTLADRRTILGDERGRLKEDQWTPEEKAKVDVWIQERGQLQWKSRVAEALQAIEQSQAKTVSTQSADPLAVAVYVTAGQAFRRTTSEGNSTDPIEPVPEDRLTDAAAPYAWPLGHAVRPARWSLGAAGCGECHGAESPFFYAQVPAVATIVGIEGAPKRAYELQGADIDQLEKWSSLFVGRTWFKGLGLTSLALLAVIILGSLAWSIGRRISRVGVS
jgi:hypothetical protein